MELEVFPTQISTVPRNCDYFVLNFLHFLLFSIISNIYNPVENVDILFEVSNSFCLNFNRETSITFSKLRVNDVSACCSWSVYVEYFTPVSPVFNHSISQTDKCSRHFALLAKVRHVFRTTICRNFEVSGDLSEEW